MHAEQQVQHELHSGWADALRAVPALMTAAAIHSLLLYARLTADFATEVRLRMAEHGDPVWAVVKNVAKVLHGASGFVTAQQELEFQGSARTKRALTKALLERAEPGKPLSAFAFYVQQAHAATFTFVRGGVSGSLAPRHRVLAAHALGGLTVPLFKDGLTGRLLGPFCVNERSQLGDFGSGDGDQLAAFASVLPAQVVFGFECEPNHLLVSDHYLGQVQAALRAKQLKFRAPIATACCNLAEVKTFDPLTHIFAYVGCQEIGDAVERAVALSTTLRAVLVVCCHADLIDLVLDHGFSKYGEGYKPDGAGDAILQLASFSCAGSQSMTYTTFLIPVSPQRRAHVLRRLEHEKAASLLCATKELPTLATCKTFA